MANSQTDNPRNPTKTINPRTSRLITAIAAALLLAGASAHAASGTWTATNGTTWSTTDNNWTGVTGTPWDSSNGGTNTANFTNTSGSATVSGTVYANQLTYTAASGSFSINSATINLAGTTPSISVNTNPTQTNGSTLAGSTAWSKAGTGNLTLSGSNSFSGDLTVSAGRLVVSNANALGTTGGTNSVTSGAALVLGNGVAVTGETVTINGSGTDFNGALTVGASTSATWNGTVILGASQSRVGGGDNGTLTLGGAIQGSGQNLQVRGNNTASTVIVSAASGNNTYSGTTQIVQGTLKLGAENTLPTGTTLDVDSSSASVDAIFDLNGFNQTVAGLQRTGAGSGAGGSFVTNSGSAATLTINQSANTTYSGNIAGSLALTKSGAGTLTLTGTNSNTGATIISGGSLAIGTGGQLSTNSAITNNANLTANSTGALAQGTHFSGAAIAGTGSFTQLGSGTTTLNAANTFSGVTLISAGKVVLGHTLALQNSAYDTTGSTGAIGLDVTGFTAPTLGGLRGSVDLATAITGYSAVTNLILNPQAGASNSYSGVIANGAAGMTVTKTGAGTQVLSGTNTFTGQLTVAEGAISVSTVNNSGADGVLGNSTNSVILGSNGKSGTLSFNTSTVTTTKRFTMATGGTGVFDIASGLLTLNGSINGSGALSKTGAGALVLAVANTYSGGSTLGGSGVVSVTADSAGPAGAPTSGPLGTGTVDLAGAQIRAGTAGSRTIGNAVTISADTTFATTAGEKSLTFTGPVTLSNATRTLNVLVGSTVATEKLTYSGAIGDGGNGYGITKTGAGNMVLSGNNTYSGATTIAGGTLRISGNSRLGNTNTTLTISNAGVLDVTAAGTLTNAITIGAGNGVLSNSSGGALVIAGAVSKNGTVLTSRSGSGTNVFTGVISGASANSDFIVDGGTTVFSNAMTYNGPTIITHGGTLVLGMNNAVPTSSGLVLGGGTFIVGNSSTHYSQTLGTLTLTENSVIDLGSYSGSPLVQLTFANSSAVSWVAGKTLTITNWQGVALQSSDVAEIIFGTGGLTSTQLGQVYWANQNINGGALISGGELVPIPEPRVYAAAVALLAAVGWRERRRLLGLLRRRK
ncbi:MAG: beta strand repeat-containing protein [Chthoniobacterales bacterium]